MQVAETLNSIHADQQYLVIGLGQSGYSAASYLLQKGYRCQVLDTRDQPPLAATFRAQFPDAEMLLGAALEEDLLSAADCVVVSPGVSVRQTFFTEAQRRGIRVIGDIELFAEAADAPVYAITGSNGKSTVTRWLGDMFEAAGIAAGVGGNIGEPALDLLGRGFQAYVLELSSYQLETTYSLKPRAAALLNVSEDHLDRYDGFEDYAATKKLVYRDAEQCVFNSDDLLTKPARDGIGFSLQHSSARYAVIENRQAENWLSVEGEAFFNTTQMQVSGRHNWANALAAIAMAQIAGIHDDAIRRTLGTFTGLPHRSQLVAEIAGVRWINDSKATNPGATLAAIQGIAGRDSGKSLWLLAGGQSKQADVSLLCDTLKRYVKGVMLFGEDAGLLQQAWQDCTQLIRVDDLQQAVLQAHQHAVKGDQVLLSPACASFDQFKNFMQRGEHFVQLVEALR